MQNIQGRSSNSRSYSFYRRRVYLNYHHFQGQAAPVSITNWFIASTVGLGIWSKLTTLRMLSQWISTFFDFSKEKQLEQLARLLRIIPASQPQLDRPVRHFYNRMSDIKVRIFSFYSNNKVLANCDRNRTTNCHKLIFVWTRSSNTTTAVYWRNTDFVRLDTWVWM